MSLMCLLVLCSNNSICLQLTRNLMLKKKFYSVYSSIGLYLPVFWLQSFLMTFDVTIINPKKYFKNIEKQEIRRRFCILLGCWQPFGYIYCEFMTLEDISRLL